jgi:hypothetical protein
VGPSRHQGSRQFRQKPEVAKKSYRGSHRRPGARLQRTPVASGPSPQGHKSPSLRRCPGSQEGLAPPGLAQQRTGWLVRRCGKTVRLGHHLLHIPLLSTAAVESEPEAQSTPQTHEKGIARPQRYPAGDRSLPAASRKNRAADEGDQCVRKTLPSLLAARLVAPGGPLSHFVVPALRGLQMPVGKLADPCHNSLTNSRRQCGKARL